MKVFMQHGAGCNRCLLTFFFEDFYGDIRSRNYDEVSEHTDEVFISSSLWNTHYNYSERVQSRQLDHKPTISEIKEFYAETLRCLEWN